MRPSANNQLYLASIAGVEVIAALTRRARGGLITQKQFDKAIRRFEREFINRYVIIEIDSPLISQAMGFARKHALRGYDAVQLAAALQVQQRRQSLRLQPLTLVSADDELNNAALVEGLLVENPNNHP